MKNWKRALAFVLVLTLCAGLCPAADAEDAGGIEPLARIHTNGSPETVESLEAFSEHWFSDDAVISEDLSDSPGLAYSLTISDATQFTQGLPAGYDPEALLQWGMDPGLGIDLLHEKGFDGSGTAVAYVDQPIADHSQYKDVDLHYTNNASDSDNSMHGPAVLSFLAGKDIGTVPEATVYYYGHSAWKADQTTHAECLYQIIEKNKTLPEADRIRMVGFSDNIDESEKNADALRAAVQACEDAGIMVWFCGEYGAASFLPMSDRNDPENLTWDSWVQPGRQPELVYVPAGSRTSAATLYGANYIYWASGGLSWTMPYVLGVYAIGLQIDPSLTQDELRELIVNTAYTNAAGMRIVDPVAFAAAVLDGVGRTAEAADLRQEQTARKQYFYALMDTASMTKEDLVSVADYLSSITHACVLVVDTSGYTNAAEIYTALQQDAAARGGTTAGVQIFGTPSMVPAFEIGYRVQMANEVDEGGTLLTDLFYGNLENNVSDIADGYNVLDHFAEEWDVDLVPQWPVARLPLSKGEFTAFFEKYDSFMTATGLERQTLVNFSNPIFASSQHTDDMGAFLNRMNREFGLLEADDYRLYGNQLGSYPVTTPVLGGFTAENLTAENQKETVEFIINSHGQRDNIDCCYFENGKEVRASLINSDTINQVLAANPYYLDCWTCNNGYGMADNLTTTALAGQCVGMFSATTIISNNGVNCDADLNQMQNSNFYWFYYNYFKALQEGSSRAQAFHSAQQAYAKALIADSANGIRPNANYQFNLYNLLAYENFGVIEPNAAAASLYNSAGYIAQAGQSVPKDPPSGGGNGNSGLFEYGGVTYRAVIGHLDDGYYSGQSFVNAIIEENEKTTFDCYLWLLEVDGFNEAPTEAYQAFYDRYQWDITVEGHNAAVVEDPVALEDGIHYYVPVTMNGVGSGYLNIQLTAGTRKTTLHSNNLYVGLAEQLILDENGVAVFEEPDAARYGLYSYYVDLGKLAENVTMTAQLDGTAHGSIRQDSTTFYWHRWGGSVDSRAYDLEINERYARFVVYYFDEEPFSGSVTLTGGTLCQHTETVLPGKDATCTEAGLTEGKICSACEAVLVQQQIIPANGHRVQNGICTVCGADYPLPLTDGKPVGEPVDILADCGYNDILANGTFTHHSMTTQKLDNGYYRLTHSFTAPAGLQTYFFSPPSGQVFGYYGPVTTGGQDTLTIDLSAEELLEAEFLTINHYRAMDDRFFVFLDAEEIMVESSVHAHTLVDIPGKEATCTADGLTEGKKCSLCGEITVNQKTIPALGHDLVEETVDGVLQERCTRCEHVKIGAAAATVTDKTVTVTLAEVTEPTWSYVTIYDDLGRFVEVKVVEIVDGKAEVTFTDNRIDDLKVFFLGESKTPLLNALTF